MITGRRSATGKYSLQRRSSGNKAVIASHMPEDDWSVRIVFKHLEEIQIPILKVTIVEAELLWAALNGMAADFDWKDKIEGGS